LQPPANKSQSQSSEIPFGPVFSFQFLAFSVGENSRQIVGVELAGTTNATRQSERPRPASHLGRVRNARRAQQSYGTTMTESIGESHLLRALSRLSILEEEIEDSLPARKRELKRLKRRASRRRSSCNNSLIVGSSLDTSLDEPRPRTRYALDFFFHWFSGHC
jgi:hypothetical protein